MTHNRYLVHVAGYNLGVLMRALFGAGTPREAAAARNAFVFIIQAAEAVVVVVVAACDEQIAALVITVAPDAAGSNRDFFSGLLKGPPQPTNSTFELMRNSKKNVTRLWISWLP